LYSFFQNKQAKEAEEEEEEEEETRPQPLFAGSVHVGAYG
jgi:hypothetical protein